MENKILFAAGLGSTGSSALVDLLKEVNGFYSMDDEFRLFVDPGGLINLRDALVENWSIFQTDKAISDFKSLVKDLNFRHKNRYAGLNHSKYFDNYLIEQANKLIDNISELQFRGLWYGNATRFERKLNKFSFLRKTKLGSKHMYVGKNLTDEEFSLYIQEFINNLVDYLLKKHKKSFFCFNENLSCMFPEKVFTMLPNAKMILIIRDPKDVYADSLRVKWAAIPEDSKEFIKWQIAVYKGWMKVQERFLSFKNNDKLLKVVKFEDLVGNYESTVKDIFNFLNIDKADHINKKKFLIPEKSIKNIGQWKNILSDAEINSFERELSFFYKFYNYSK